MSSSAVVVHHVIVNIDPRSGRIISQFDHFRGLDAAGGTERRRRAPTDTDVTGRFANVPRDTSMIDEICTRIGRMDHRDPASEHTLVELSFGAARPAV